jgi:hypothetical protein
MMGKGSIRAAAAVAVALTAVLFAATARADDRSLLTPDGTLFRVESGTYQSLVPGGAEAQPSDYVILWTAKSQTGEVRSGLIPGTATPEVKDQFDLAWDSISQTLLVVWTNRFTVVNSVDFAIYHGGEWTKSSLPASSPFTFAANPKLVLTHQTMKTLDADGNEVDTPRSIASVVWWEDSVVPRARFAPIFIENGVVDLADVTIYDLPLLTGGALPSSSSDFTNPLFRSPSIQPDGFSSAVLLSFGDAAAGVLQLVRVDFPSDFRAPAVPDRGRHVIVILGQKSVPAPGEVSGSIDLSGSVIGGDYEPTVYWKTDGENAVSYSIFDGTNWSAPKNVPLSDRIGTDAAVALIRAMALQN